MRNIATPARVGLLVVLGLVAFFVFLTFIQDQGLSGARTEYSVVFRDASGIAPRTLVRIAGIPVGEVTRIELERGRARIWFTVRSDVPVYPNARMAKRSASILGDYVLDLDPGYPVEERERGELGRQRGFQDGEASDSPGSRPLPPGGEIVHVQEAVEIERIFESLDQITADVEAITAALREALVGEENSVRRIVENLDSLTARLDRTIADASLRLEQILENTEAVTADLRAVTAARAEDVSTIIGNVRQITEQTREILASVHAFVGREAEEGGGGIRDAMARLNATLEHLEAIAAKIDRGEGTVGRLVSDEELAQKVEGAVWEAADYIERLTAIRVEVALRSEYLMREGETKNYLRLRIVPRPDRYFLFEAVDDPRGTVQRQTVVRSPPAPDEVANQEIRVTSESLKFSAQFARRWGFATFRFGLVESTGGLGLDLHFLDDHLAFVVDAFEFANPEKDYPRLKAHLNLLFLSHFFVTAGMDDLLNPRQLDPLTGQMLSGRDWFFGGGIYFTDEDLRVLLGVVP